MVTSLRLLGLSLLALLVSAGLIGCAVFSAGASTPAEMMSVMPAMERHQHDHAHHMAPGDPAPAHDHGSEDCEGCDRSLLNRISIAPDLTPVFEQLPAHVFVIPAAMQFDAEKDIPDRAVWPPGDEPPIRPDTLTHRKISLLI